MALVQHDPRLAPEVGLLTPGDTDTVQAVFDGLTETQRYQRFHVSMPVLPGYMRRLLADVDGVRHAALVLRIGGRPVGIARYVATSPVEAEAAIALTSDVAGRGYGTGLLEELVAHAYRHGVTRLSFEFLAENQAARHLVERHGATFRREGTKFRGLLSTAAAALRQHAAAG